MPKFKSIIKCYDIDNNSLATIDGGKDIVQESDYELYNQVCNALRESGKPESVIAKIAKVWVCYENLQYQQSNSPILA